MMRSLFSGVSGLKSHQTGMDTIGNNIANVNTVGFKASRTTFADTLSQTLTGASAPGDTVGGTNPKQIGLGTGVASIDMIFTDGSIQSTGKNTDLCLSGNGLFVVKNGDQTYYTRDGAFEFDAAGNYVLPGSGLYVQGWTATDGVLSTNGAAGNITIPAGKSMAAKSTGTISYANNLNASTKGYNIGGILINYTDGTSETVNSYSPTSSAGKVTITYADGTTELVDSGNALDLNSPVGTTLWDDEVTSATANANGAVDIEMRDSGKYKGMTLANTKLNNLKSGTYTVGGTYLSAEVITDVEVLANGDVKLIFGGAGGAGNVTNITLDATTAGNYKDGDTFNVELEVTTVKAYTGATITTKNHGTVTVDAQSTPSPAEVGANFTKKTKADISAISTSSAGTYDFNGKTVKSVTVTATDGTTLSGLMGNDYNAGDTFYPSVTTTATVYGSQGRAYNVPLLFTKTDANTWGLSLTGGGSSGSITADDGSTATLSLDTSDLVFDAAGKYVSGSATLTITPDNGEDAPQSVAVNLAALTQYSGNSTVNAEADGNAAGTLSSVSVDSSGVITGTYTNGMKQTEAQVAIAQFTNASGLTKTGNSLYQESNNSGTANVKTAADLGCTITPSALEMSTTDISNEFSNMIITQRGFQSNSKIITVSDEMLETLINMKR